MPVLDTVQLSSVSDDSLKIGSLRHDSVIEHQAFKKMQLYDTNDTLKAAVRSKRRITNENDTVLQANLLQSSADRNKQGIHVNEGNTDTLIVSTDKENGPGLTFFTLPHKKFDYAQLPIWQDIKTNAITGHNLTFNPHIAQQSHLNWTLLVFFISVTLILGVNSYYRKFINKVITSLVNFQLADKLFREKNIIVRRAFFMMNLNFLLVFSLFIMLLMDLFEVGFTNSNILDFLLILAIVTGIVLIRLLLYYIVAFILEWIPAVDQQIHFIYLINKNIGLILLPMVFTAIYTSPGVSRIIIFAGIGLISLAFVYKLFRGFQIIIKNGILLYYAILYLCTLELLPWVLSSKLFIYLR